MSAMDLVEEDMVVAVRSSGSERAMLRVQFDAQLLAWQLRGGISTYFSHLVATFQQDRQLGIRATGVPQYTINPQAIELGLGRPLPRYLPRRVRLVQALNRPRQLGARISRPDAIHYTYYANERLSGATRAKRVVTVHDMIPELRPELYPSGNPHQHKMAHVAAADLILCVSETTRHDLLEFMPSVADRVRVTPLGAPPVVSSDSYNANQMGASRRPFLLFVGVRERYKNFDVLLRALARTDKDLQLVVAGGGTLTTSEIDRIRALGVEERIRQCTPTDDELQVLYRTALAFVFPSRIEGFGLPVLEAMAFGCPALLARTPIFEEVAGDAALFFDPDDDDALSDFVSTLLHNDEERARITSRARVRALEHSWTRTAAATALAYDEVTRG